ncbi:MAG: ABC transporter substrate-binding protein [Thermodesulfobacteriota bacterium]
MRGLKLFGCLFLALAVLTVGAPTGASAAANELTIAIFGGSFADMTKKCHVEPFEKKHQAKVNIVQGISTENLAKLRAQKSNPQIDVAYMDISLAPLARNEGLTDKMDPAKITNLNQLYDKARTPDNYFVAQLFAGCGLAYNKKEVKDPPKSWADLWHPRFKGKIALCDITGTAGWMTLLMAAKINGGSITNLDPGFAAIKKLKGDVVTFYTHADQLVSLLERGEVWVAPWYHDRAAFSEKKGLPIGFSFPKEGAVAILPGLVLVKNGPNKDLAEKYINEVLSESGQACFAENMFEGPVNKNVKLPPELAAKLPYGQEQIEAMVVPDYEYVGKNQAQWTERWNKEITR